MPEAVSQATSSRNEQPEPTAPPLSDAELERIPAAVREHAGGLSRAAKDVYRVMRRYARGGELAWPATTTLARRLSCSEDTVQRAHRELEAKGYVERTGRKRGRAVEYRLLRGRGEVYELRRLAPHPAVEEPQSAADTYGRTEGGPFGPDLPRSRRSAAASPLPARAGEAAARHEEPPELTDEERDELARRARAFLEHLRFGAVLERHAAVDDGPCVDCHSDSIVPRWQFGRVAVCREHLSGRYAASLRLAAEAARAVRP